MSLLKQIRAVTALNIRSIPARLGSSWVLVIGIAGVVGVLVSVLGMTQSLSSTVLASGRDDRAIVIRGGANNELSSTLPVEAVFTIKDAPGVARTPHGDAAATADMVTGANFLRKEDGTRAGVGVRGVDPESFFVRPEIEIVAGRRFEPGLRELIVGQNAQAEFQGLEIGDVVGLSGSQWTVVGTFASGDAHESGMLTDATTLRSAYQRNTSSVTVQLESAGAFDTFRDALTADPTLNVEVLREPEYFARQSENATGVLNAVNYFVAGLMALGALFAALNTMYSAVSSRAVEIATLRAIGFGSSGVVVSVLAEAVLLAFLGALIGATGAWLLFSDYTTSLGGSISSLVFEVRVTPALVVLGVVWACAVGLVGGMFPALRAARLPVATALRSV